VEIRLSGGHQNKENQNMENTGAIHSEVSQTQTVHTGKATSQCGANEPTGEPCGNTGVWRQIKGRMFSGRLILCDYHAKALEQHGFAVRTMRAEERPKRAKSLSALWRERKVAKGLCGYCGKQPIAYLRSRSRCAKCLESNQLLQMKYRRGTHCANRLELKSNSNEYKLN